jgi:integrase
VNVFGVVDIKHQLHRLTYKETKAKTVGLVGILSEKTQVSLAQAWLEAHERGQECLFEHLPPLSFESNFQKAVSKLPFEYRHLTPHDLRHTFCTRAAAVVPEPCRDLLMSFTRHSNWTVCERYRHNLRLLRGKKPEIQAANIEHIKSLVLKKSVS